MEKVIGYVRVSTDKQADKGVSLEAQAEKLRGYASLYNLDLVDIVRDEGVSAKTLDRPGLKFVLAKVRSGEVSGVLVAKLDRLTRSVRDLGELLEDYFADADLLSVAEHIDTRTSAGRLVLNVLASVSQWEREAIGERTSTALQHKRANGERVGFVPYGFRLAGKILVADPEEQAVIDRIKGDLSNGVSYRDIVRHLNAEGVPSPSSRVDRQRKGDKGREWHLSTIQRIVGRE